ncbi:MAG: hypothetical protein ACON44_01045 [Candidatus Puniceispirillaceae bacterium]
MFGRKKKQKQPEQLQVSLDTLALLQAMRAGQQVAPQQQQAMPQMPPQPMGQQPLTPEQQMLMMQQLAAQQQMATQQMPQAGTVPPAPQADPAIQQQMAQQMPAQQIPAQQMVPPADQMPQQMAQPSEQAAQAAQPTDATASSFGLNPAAMAGGFAEDNPAMPAATTPLTKEQKREQKRQKKAQAKEEAAAKKAAKAAAISEKKEEKKRAKRRKKLSKTRFSRARYLREANGNALAAVVLWLFLIIIFVAGPFMLNTAILIPQTNENLRIIREVDQLERSIQVNQPQITATLQKRNEKQKRIESFTRSFTPQAQATAILEDFVTQLEEAGMDVMKSTIQTVGLTAQSIVGTGISLTVEGNYLDWLRVRNKFIRTQRAVSIPNESVEVNEEATAMSITALIVLPSSK